MYHTPIVVNNFWLILTYFWHVKYFLLTKQNPVKKSWPASKTCRCYLVKTFRPPNKIRPPSSSVGKFYSFNLFLWLVSLVKKTKHTKPQKIINLFFGCWKTEGLSNPTYLLEAVSKENPRWVDSAGANRSSGGAWRIRATGGVETKRGGRVALVLLFWRFLRSMSLCLTFLFGAFCGLWLSFFSRVLEGKSKVFFGFGNFALDSLESQDVNPKESVQRTRMLSQDVVIVNPRCVAQRTFL